MKAKALVFILDGLGDRPSAALDGLTPLQAAATPNLDRLARAHRCGLMDPLRPGLVVDTHTGAGILLGLPPRAASDLRRGPIEAAGIDLDARDGDVLLRANFASVESDGMRIIDRRAGRIGFEAATLCAALQDIEVGDGITASVHPATQHRAVLQLRGANLSAAISDTDPGGGDEMAHAILQAMPKTYADDIAAATRTADALNAFTARAHAILTTHPVNVARAARGAPVANAIIARSAGMQRALANRLRDLGLRVAAVAGESTILGLAKLFGFTAITRAQFTSLPDTDLDEKLRVATEALRDHDLVYLHIKGTDTTAHDRNPKLKAQFIARFDRALGAMNFGDTIIGVCADHCTDSNSGEHAGDPVPVLLANPNAVDDKQRDAVTAYHEHACADGALGRITAQEYLELVLAAMGARDGDQSNQPSVAAR